MNQRESNGLPIRAIVMVLLFLGIAFLLVGWNATRSGDDSDSTESSSVTTVASATASASSTTTPPPAAKPDVWVFNTSGVNNAGADIAAKLANPGWNVPPAGNRDPVEGVEVTTVYFPAGSAGDEAAAREIGRILGDAPVVERIPALDDVKPGVVVLVAGVPG
jgi:LytR cell envelope-related transcriptional attenuator